VDGRLFSVDVDNHDSQFSSLAITTQTGDAMISKYSNSCATFSGFSINESIMQLFEFVKTGYVIGGCE
jgi:hypothetical protein